MNAQQHTSEAVDATASPLPPEVSESRPPALLALGHFALAIAVFVGSLPGLTACGGHPHRGSADRANEIAEIAYESPQEAAERAAAEIERLLERLDDWRVARVGDVEDEETEAERRVEKHRRDYYRDRHTMALCQNYLTLGRANAELGANEEAQRAFQHAIDAANKYVGEHIQLVMDSEPEVFRTIKAYFRSKKVEMTAYVQLRQLAYRAGNEALASVYDIKARYAKMYLDSLLAVEEMKTVTDWEAESAKQDDSRFLGHFWLGFSIVAVVGLVVLAGALLIDGEDGVMSVIGVAAAVVVAIGALALLFEVHRGAQESIDATALEGLGDLHAFIDRVQDIPELAALPSFEEFRRSVEETQRLADEGDSVGAARAFLDSYVHLSDAEQELERLRDRYASETSGTTAPGPSS